MIRHWSNDELVDRLYGLGNGDSHLDGCPECAGRWNRLREQRAMAAEPDAVSSEFLAAQRRSIYSRLGDPPRARMKWAPAVAAACLVAVGLFVYRPVPAPRAELGDSQLLADVYSMEQSMEPRGAEPIHALFEDE